MNRFRMVFPLLDVMTLLLSGCINGRVISLRPTGATHMRTIESTTDVHGLEEKAASQAVGCTVHPSHQRAIGTLCHSRNHRTGPSC